MRTAMDTRWNGGGGGALPVTESHPADHVLRPRVASEQLETAKTSDAALGSLPGPPPAPPARLKGAPARVARALLQLEDARRRVEDVGNRAREREQAFRERALESRHRSAKLALARGLIEGAAEIAGGIASSLSSSSPSSEAGASPSDQGLGAPLLGIAAKASEMASPIFHYIEADADRSALGFDHAAAEASRSGERAREGSTRGRAAAERMFAHLRAILEEGRASAAAATRP